MPGGGPPALATRMSTCPRVAATSDNIASIDLSSVRSAATKIGSPATVSNAAASFLTERETNATRTPSVARACAEARPRPVEAPVTSAVRPAMPRSMIGR